jgi:hypothetical protein
MLERRALYRILLLLGRVMQGVEFYFEMDVSEQLIILILFSLKDTIF